jgi:hypothetical protein
MGFEREDVLQALRMSGNDYELACEYLLNSDSRAEANILLEVPSQ